MTARRLLSTLLVLAGLASLAATSAAVAVTTPGRTLVAPGLVRDLALTNASIAYVADVPGSCRKNVHLWNTATRGTWTFPGRVFCEDGPSTGAGIADVGVATRRVLWLSYAGGNFRDWLLYTATTTKKTPKQIRFVSRPVEDPAPIVIGQGTALGVPFAVDAKVTYLGDNGAAIFTWTAPATVVGLAAGTGPGAARVAVALENGDVALLSTTGKVLSTVSLGSAPTAVRLAPAGLVAQVDASVRIVNGALTKVVDLPAAARMLDYANGRILYAKGPQIRTRAVLSGLDAPLLPVTGAKAPPVGLETRGLAWSVGKRVNWACAGCIDYNG